MSGAWRLPVVLLLACRLALSHASLAVDASSTAAPASSGVGETSGAAVGVDDTTGLPVLFVTSLSGEQASFTLAGDVWEAVSHPGTASHRAVSPLWWGAGVFAPASAVHDARTCYRRLDTASSWTPARAACGAERAGARLAATTSDSREVGVFFTSGLPESWTAGAQLLTPAPMLTGWQWVDQEFFLGSEVLQADVQGEGVWDSGEPK